MLLIDHVILIGMNFQPRRSSGDKNFWVELLPLIAKSFAKITVLSIRNHNISSERFAIGNCQVTVKYLKPKFLETPDAVNSTRRIFWKKGFFPRWLGVIEKLLNLKTLLTCLKVQGRETPFQHVHLMDNLGFINRVLAGKINTSMTVSAIAYFGKKNNRFYDAFLRVCYKAENITVIPYSNSYLEKLITIGIDKRKIVRIPWGIIGNNPEGSTLNTKKEIVTGMPLILWTGYIQQIKRNDFLYARDIAEKAIELGLDATFFFAFKPESFEDGFEKYDCPEKGIIVKPTTVDEFCTVKRKSKIMFSPVIQKNVILAPPLTWIEMMGAGVPVVTMDVPGAAEAVLDGKTGYIAANDEELISKLFLAVDNYRQLSGSCVKHIQENYNLEDIANQYVKLWNAAACERSQPYRGNEIQG